MAINITAYPDQLTASKNDVWVSFDTIDVNIIMRLDIYTLPADKKIATIFAPVDAVNNSIYNLKTILQSMGQVPDLLRYQLPGFNQVITSDSLNNIREYYFIIYTIDKITGAEISNVMYRNGQQVLLAGKNFINGNKPLLDIIGTGAASLRKFLTCQPSIKKTSPNQQQYLYYYHNEAGISSGAVGINLKIGLTFNDGSTIDQLLFPVSIQNGKITIFPTGYSQLNLAPLIPPGKRLIEYRAELVLQSDPSKAITQNQRYEMDYRCFPKRKDFVFVNSMGGVDSIFVVDTQEFNVNIITETAERFLPRNYNVTNGQYYNFYKESNRVYKCNTDLLTFRDREYLQEFFLSTNIFEVAGDKFLPILLTDSNFALHKNRPEIQSVQFGFRYAFDDLAYNNF